MAMNKEEQHSSVQSLMDLRETLENEGIKTPTQDMVSMNDEAIPRERNKKYGDALDWLNHKGDYKNDEHDAGHIISQLFDMQVKKFILEEIDAWASALVQYVRDHKEEDLDLDTYLAKVWILTKIEHSIENLTEFHAGIAYAQQETLTNLAKAGGTSQPNVRTKWKKLGTIATAFKKMALSHEPQIVNLDGLEVQFNYGGE